MDRFQYTLEELVTLVAGSLIFQGDASNVVLTNIESLGKAGASDLSFLGNAKYRKDFESSKAGAILVDKSIDSHPNPHTALIVVENASVALAVLTEHIQQERLPSAGGVSPAANIDPTANIHPEAAYIDANATIMAGTTIGKGSRIDAGVVLYPNVQIGDDCHLQANVVVREQCKLGDRCTIQPNTVIGSDGYGYEFTEGHHKKVPQIGNVIIEDDVEIGANSCVDRARFGSTRIGKGTKIDNLVQIAHNVEIGQHALIVAQSGIAGSSSVGNYTTIAAQSGVVGHVKVGDQIVLLARSAFTKDVKEKGFYAGYPAQKRGVENRQQAHLHKLGDLVKQVKQLEKEITELKKASDEE